MNKILQVIVLMLLSSSMLSAQIPPPAINYQAVARNVNGTVLNNTQIIVRIGIVATSPTGTLNYSENHVVVTNQYGIFTVAIGRGTVFLGDFSTINWGADTYWLRVELDLLNTGSYILLGTSELLSVPYALYSANSATPGPVGPTGSSITGPTGPTGAMGIAGSAGTNGVNGTNGTNGTNGLNGAAGAVGPTGAAGANGAAGVTGATGAAGANGLAGSTGIVGATGATGSAGAAGLAGATGAIGVSGSTGPSGPTGPSGNDGSTGATGPLGGPTGPTGSTGAAGVTGAFGGPTGPTGATGANGTAGAAGASGAAGAAGAAGATGATGATGIGTAGATGVTGPTGAGGSLTSSSLTSNNNGPAACGAGTPFAGAGLPGAINDFTTTSSNITVVGMSGTVCNVTVTIDVTHTFDGDLSISLMSPLGTIIDLSSINGAGGDNYTGTIFNDAAATSITLGAAPFIGSYIPEQPLATFNGEAPNGVWVLSVTDGVGADVGTFNSASITITTGAALSYIGETSIAVTAGQTTLINADYSTQASTTADVVFRVSRDVISGAGSVGTVIGFCTNSPAAINKFVSCSVSDRETGLATGTYYYKLWKISSPVAGSENYSIVVTKH